MTLDLTQYSQFINKVYYDTPTTKELARSVLWTKDDVYNIYPRILRLVGIVQYGLKWCNITLPLIDSFDYVNNEGVEQPQANYYYKIRYNNGYFIRNLQIDFTFDPRFSTLSSPNWPEFRVIIVKFPTQIHAAFGEVGVDPQGRREKAATRERYENLLIQAIPGLGDQFILAQSKPILLKNKLCKTRISLPDVQFIPRGYDMRMVFAAVDRYQNLQAGDFDYYITCHLQCEFYGDTGTMPTFSRTTTYPIQN